MSKLTWKDLEEKNIAIHTPTEDLMELVVNVIAKKYDDITYEEYIKDPDALFNCYKENTCVELNEDMDEFDSYIYEWAYDDIEGYSSDNYQIVEYEEVKHLFELERTVKPNQIYRHFKKGNYYATLGVSKPIDEEEFGSIISKSGLDKSIKSQYIFHTELEKQIIVAQKDGELYHRSHNSEDELVIYTPLYFSDYPIYARPKNMFLSPVDQDKYKNATQEYRMELIK